jgi:predicted SAM-dependent methyltransferase
MDFSRTDFRTSRQLTSYAKVRYAISFLLRKWPIKKPYPHGNFYLDLGPGPNASPDFFNIDYSWHPGIDMVCDLTRNFHPPEGRVQGCFTEHCIEHLPFEATLHILCKINRSLVAGGVLRIVVPDLQLYCAQVVDQNTLGSDLSLPHQRSVSGICSAATALNDVVRLHGHLFLWDYATLEILLTKAGFKHVTREAFMRGKDEKLLKDSDSRAYESLYVEAVK